MSPSSATPVSGDVLGEKYRLVRLIGEGGMGCVFEATNTLTDKRVAVKWLKPELAHNPDVLQRFLREARLTSRIEHPNVVQVFDVARHGDAYFIVMELLQGESLAHAVASRMLSIHESVDTMIAVMRGVAEAHAAGIIHRDLKPDNIFLPVDRRGHRREPKVLDFGISKLQTRDSLETTTSKMTREGQMLGTPYYMSPEQLEGGPNIDARADVYALGVILYEVLTRRVPFEADTLTGILMRIIENRPRPPSELRNELPKELEAVVLKAMARDPAQRFQSVDALARALEPFATVRFSSTNELSLSRSLPYVETLAQTPMIADEVVRPPVRRTPRAMWIGVGVAAAALVGLWWVASRTPDAELARDGVERPAAPVAAVPEPAAAARPSIAAPAAPDEPAAPAPAPAAAPAPAPAVDVKPVDVAASDAALPSAPAAKAGDRAGKAPRAPRKRADQPSEPSAPVAADTPIAPAAPVAPKKPKSSKSAPELVGF